MGVLGRFFGIERKSTALSFANFPDWQHAGASRSGPSVNWKTALDVTTVLACVQVLANGVSQVPWRLYKTLPGNAGSIPAVDHPLYDVLYRRPNPWQTSFEFRQTMVFHRALTGNFFAFKNVVDGNIRELIPIEPGHMEVKRLADMTLRYLVTGIDGQRREFPAETIWHLRGASWDNWRGLETVRLAREAIGLAIATETAHAELHRNGIQTSGLYSMDGTVTADQYKLLRAYLKERIDAHLSHEPMIMDRNAKFTPTSMSGVDAQHIETRRFQVEEICRAFNVKPIMIGHSDKTATYASAEQMFLAHAVHTLGPWYEEIDQSADVNLLGDAGDVYTKLNANALMRAAAADRSAFYAKALGAGGSPAWMTQNEVRALEELNPLPGGDELPKPTPPKPPTPPDPGAD